MSLQESCPWWGRDQAMCALSFRHGVSRVKTPSQPLQLQPPFVLVSFEMKNVLPRLKWEQYFLGMLKQIASLQTHPEVIGRLSERETMECSMPAWTNYKAEEGKGNEGVEKGAWVWGSSTATLARSKLSAKRMFTVLKSGFKEQVAGMSLHYSPLR